MATVLTQAPVRDAVENQDEDYKRLEPGTYTARRLPDWIYHGDTSTMSSTHARLIIQPGGPAKLKYSFDHPREEQDFFRFGQAAHALILEHKRPPVCPYPNMRRKEARQWKLAQELSHLPWVKHEEGPMLDEMLGRVKAHPAARAVLSMRGRAEVSIVYDHPSGVRCKARIDYLPYRAKNIILPVVDYKTTGSSAGPEAFAKRCYDAGYYQQAAWYIDALKSIDYAVSYEFIFIVQEKTPPFNVGVYRLNEDAIEAGRALNEKAIRMWAQCTDSNEWPGLSSEMKEIDLPAWAYQKIEALA